MLCYTLCDAMLTIVFVVVSPPLPPGAPPPCVEPTPFSQEIQQGLPRAPGYRRSAPGRSCPPLKRDFCCGGRVAGKADSQTSHAISPPASGGRCRNQCLGAPGRDDVRCAAVRLLAIAPSLLISDAFSLHPAHLMVIYRIVPSPYPSPYGAARLCELFTECAYMLCMQKPSLSLCH